METMQPWATGFNRPKPLPTQMMLQRSQPPALSREEQLEARRLAEESNFTYAGYQVVRRESTTPDSWRALRSPCRTQWSSCKAARNPKA